MKAITSWILNFGRYKYAVFYLSFINFIVTVIVLLFMLAFHNVQNGFGYKEIMMEVKRMRGDFLVGCVCIFLIQAISRFVTKGILG